MKRNVKRWGAWIMALIMLCSLVMVPAGKVEAAAVSVDLNPETGSKTETVDATGNVELRFTVPSEYNTTDKLKAAGINKLEVTFKVTSYSAAGSGTAGAQAFLGHGESWSPGGSWQNLEAGKEITSTLDLSSFLSSSESIYAYGIQFANLSGSLTYEIVSAKLTGPGTWDVENDNVSLSYTSQNQYNSYIEYKFTVKNSGSTAVSGDLVVTFDQTREKNWWTEDFSISLSGNTLTVSNISIEAGANSKSIQVQLKPIGANITSVSFAGKTISAEETKLSDSGSSGGSGGTSGSLTDTTTNKNLDIEYNYAKLLQESLYFYDANMCGPEVETKCGLSWRGNCHTEDREVTYNGKTINVSGGFHDAGDHVKFGLPQGYSAMVLALGYYEFGEAFDELGQTAHYQTIMDYFCDYFTRCTVYSGEDVEAFCYQVGDGDKDHEYWGAPEKQTGYRPAFFADASNPATDEVCVAAATLAIHAKNFPESEYAKTYLKTSKDLFAFAKKNNKECAVKGPIGSRDFYRSSDWKDDYCSALAALYVATGDVAYKTELDSMYNAESIKTGWVLTWDNTGAAAALLMEDWQKVHTFASYGNTNTAQGFKLVDTWGSARYNATCQFLGLAYDKGNDKFSVDKGDFSKWATGQMNYLLGNNNSKRCFVVGYNENSSKYPHHRAASRSSDAAETREDHYTLLGALVGGPSDANDSYKDDQNDFNCNEVALDYNAGFVGAAAGLYLLHKNDEDASNSLASEEELTKIGVTRYYGNFTSTDPIAVSGVTLNKETLEMVVGETATLKATLKPSNATEKGLRWKSSNETVATVDDNGMVTAVASGETTITVTTVEGAFTATCKVIVNKSTPTIEGEDAITVDYGTALKDIDLSGYKAVIDNATVEGTFYWEDEKITISAETENKAYKLLFRPTDETKCETASKSITIKGQKVANNKMPDKPELESKTAASVTLKSYSGTERVQYGYRVASGEYTWVDSNEITGLDEWTKYEFALRFAETSTTKEGQAGDSITVITNLKDIYKVDLGKLSKEGYIEAHDGSISYDEVANILTLEEADTKYILTGDGSGITIKVKSAVKKNTPNIILEDATAKGIDAEKDLTLGLIGNTTVKNAGIIAGGTLTIDNAGKTKVGTLDVEGENFGAILADNVIVKGGNINATGKKEAVAIKASTKIELVGGAVTANAETQSVIQAGDGTEQNPGEIIWDGCAVKSASNDIFSPNPKKSDGTEIKDICNVIYKGGKTFTVPKGEEITINEIVPVKKGFHAKGWKVDSEEDVLEIGKKIKITKDITLVPAYDEIKGELSIVQDTTVAPLVEGYTKDDGVAVTIVNNTNVTFEEINLAIDSDDFELSDSKLEQLKDKDNADGNSRTIYVKLKNGKKAGDYKTNLTVTIASGELEVINETINRTVKATEKPIAVSSITVTLDPSSVELKAEENATATVNATAIVLPENATNKQVTWTTGDSKIATVDSTGVVTVLSEGTVDIIATAADGSNITGKATLAVAKKKTEEKPDPDDSGKDPGQNPGGSGEVEPSKDTSKPNGSGGQNGGSGTGATGNTPAQTPAAPSAADEVKATGIQVTADVKKADNMLVAGTMKLAPKKKMQLNVAFLPEDADEEEVTFTSSNPKVAIVDEDGEITAGKNPGKTTITVKTERGLVKSFQIQVMKKAVTKVKLQVKTKNLKVGKSMKVKATLSPNKKLASNIIYWTSSNEDVVTVTQKGVIKGLKKGKAKITAVAADGSGKKATVTIKVK